MVGERVGARLPDIGHPFVRVTVTPVSRFIRRTLHGQMCFLVGSNPIRTGWDARSSLPPLPPVTDSCSSDVKRGEGKEAAQLRNVFSSCRPIRYFRTAVPSASRLSQSPQSVGRCGDANDRFDSQSPSMETPPTTTRHDVTTRVADGRTVYELPR